MLEFRLLGAFEVKCNGEAVHICGRPEQSLLAYLLLNSGVAHRREKLAALLWPDSPEDSARENLRHVLWRIRKALPSPPGAGCLPADDLSIAFECCPHCWLDVDILKSARDRRTADELIAALDVYRGELLPGFSEEWVSLEREYLNYYFGHNMARLLALLLSQRRWLDVLEWGERWLALGEKPEPAFRALMQAHAAMGEMSEVAGAYSRCVRSLAEIGLEPSEQTSGLYESLKNGKLS